MSLSRYAHTPTPCYINWCWCNKSPGIYTYKIHIYIYCVILLIVSIFRYGSRIDVLVIVKEKTQIILYNDLSSLTRNSVTLSNNHSPVMQCLKVYRLTSETITRPYTGYIHNHTYTKSIQIRHLTFLPPSIIHTISISLHNTVSVIVLN